MNINGVKVCQMQQFMVFIADYENHSMKRSEFGVGWLKKKIKYSNLNVTGMSIKLPLKKYAKHFHGLNNLLHRVHCIHTGML